MEVSLIIYLGFGVAGGVPATCSFFTSESCILVSQHFFFISFCRAVVKGEHNL